MTKDSNLESNILTARGYFLRYGPSMSIWRTEEIRNLIDIELPQPVLDLGCGDGYTSTFLKKSPFAGIDINISDLKVAESIGNYRILVRGNAQKLPFKSSSFGSVFSNCVLEHIPAPPEYLSEIRRILEPEGILVFSVPSEKFRLWVPGTILLDKLGFGKTAEKIRTLVSYVMKHCTEKSEEWWRVILEKSGFKVLEVRPFMNRKRYRILFFLLPLRIVFKIFMKATNSKLMPLPASTYIPRFLVGKNISCNSKEAAGLIFIVRKTN